MTMPVRRVFGAGPCGDGFRPAAGRKRRGPGFTLIELLVVIVIIFILAGILFRVVALINQKTARARAVYELEQIQNALNEYFAHYGQYPPVDFTLYEYECSTTNTQTYWFRELFLPRYDDPAGPDFFADIDRRTEDGWACPGEPGWYLGYRYGLVSYLYRREQGHQRHWYDRDTPRDVEAKDSWHHFIDDIGPDYVGGRYHPGPVLESFAAYTNSVASLIDPWGREYRYRCGPPYIRYRLWSAGPDGVDGNVDDVHKDSWSE